MSIKVTLITAPPPPVISVTLELSPDVADMLINLGERIAGPHDPARLFIEAGFSSTEQAEKMREQIRTIGKAIDGAIKARTLWTQT